ncbi:MAG: helix-turn-helix domain-containing protein [Myxococcota bacterium]
MKPLEELNHYEALEIGIDATAEQVDKAYRMLEATYEPDSLAVYSLLDAADVTAMSERIEAAYQVLSDEEGRQGYDLSLRGAEKSEVSLDDDVSGGDVEAGDHARALALEDVQALDDGEAEPRDFDGAGLRCARERRGIPLEQLAAQTKINRTYLRWIEDDNYDELPALVYVRGFVISYARAIGLDPDRVVTSYMSHLEDAQSDPPRGRRPGER